VTIVTKKKSSKQSQETSMTDSHAAKTNRLWWRYGLRSLLILVLLSSLPFAWYGWRVRKADQHRAAVQAIRDAGGQVSFSHLLGDPPGPMWLQSILRKVSIADVREVRMGSEATDADLVQVTLFTNLRTLNLSNVQITDAGLQQLGELNELQRLDLGATKATDAGLQHLKTLSSLEWLSLDRTQVTDAGLVHLKGFSRLESLHLGHTQVSDQGLEHLRELPLLANLHLGHTRIAGPGLEHLQGVRVSCLHLHLNDTQVGDAALVHLETVTQLGELTLENANITDAGLQHLSGLTRLHSLQLSGTRITDAGLVHLEELARCQLPFAQENSRNEAGPRLAPGESGELPKVHTVLQQLGLNRTQVTDAGLKRLEGFIGLEQLSVQDTQVTSEGVNEFKQSLPNCEVSF
jgi:Leucine-rich repeat (LRR) protein